MYHGRALLYYQFVYSHMFLFTEAEELRKTSISGQAELPFSPLSPLHGDGVIMLNDGGKVGLDNLGNTCYLNSSLQALLHTPHLVEYFLRKTHLREVNQHSKFGFKGRLAFAFGKLASDLWVPRGENQRQKERGGKGGISGAASSALSTLKSIGTGGIGGIGDAGGGSSVSPHKFRKELMALHEQFDNNEQHDAQEVRARKSQIDSQVDGNIVHYHFLTFNISSTSLRHQHPIITPNKTLECHFTIIFFFACFVLSLNPGTH